MKDTPPLDDRISALDKVIAAVRDLDVQSQIKVLRSAVVFLGINLYGRDESEGQE